MSIHKDELVKIIEKIAPPELMEKTGNQHIRFGLSRMEIPGKVKKNFLQV